MHKNDGGMSFKNLSALNFAMLGNQGWRVMTTLNLLISKLFKARYFLHCDFLTSKLGHNRSFVWPNLDAVHGENWANLKLHMENGPLFLHCDFQTPCATFSPFCIVIFSPSTILHVQF
jgi:hypothetical protein